MTSRPSWMTDEMWNDVWDDSDLERIPFRTRLRVARINLWAERGVRDRRLTMPQGNGLIWTIVGILAIIALVLYIF